jgi:flagellar basal-body rod modification protein FlgD
LIVRIENPNALANPRPVDRPATGPSELGRDAFMKLLVAQLQNQDPLDPMDAREMVTQLSQLTSVEQLIAIEHRLTSLEIASAGMANTQVSSLVGRNIEADVSKTRLDEAGMARSYAELQGGAANLTAVIRDAAGQEVRTLELGARTPGGHMVEWDGRNASGERMPPGRYTFEFRAIDGEGRPLAVSTKLQGVVHGVSYQQGYPELLVGENRVLLGDVTSIGM